MFSQYDENLLSYTTHFLLLSIPAIVFGYSINYFMKYIKKYYNYSPLTLFIINLLLSILLLYIIEKYVSPQFAKRWQEINPGIVFVVFYYTLQTELIENAQIVATNMIG